VWEYNDGERKKNDINGIISTIKNMVDGKFKN
jgi:hypothetical protein